MHILSTLLLVPSRAKNGLTIVWNHNRANLKYKWEIFWGAKALIHHSVKENGCYKKKKITQDSL